ncbi:hypothetical protein [Haloglomus litoreum]|uniref:hypothetical protein n=1 Tax=Haloglomus litoreum TaxID=3034026 RepID=UPI0023E83145|nr:hypothetical protein [Haloglomus sp. DT116]
MSLFGPAFVVIIYLLAVGIVPGAIPLPVFGVLAVVSLVICALSFAGTGSALRTTLACWVLALGLFGVVELARRGTESLWLVALTLVVVGGFVGYGLHRYERVRLGLVSDEP